VPTWIYGAPNSQNLGYRSCPTYVTYNSSFGGISDFAASS
jgi:hypothetical protein